MKTELAKQYQPIFPIRKNVKKSQKKITEEKIFRENVAELMRKNGASEDFIGKTLTDEALKHARINRYSAETLAWTLLL